MDLPIKKTTVTRLAFAWVLLGVGLGLAGCEAVSAVAYAVRGGEPVEKQFDLLPERTLVLVDDPHDQLGQRAMQRLIAAGVIDRLKKRHRQDEASVKVSQFVSSKELTRLKARLGDDYAITPIDSIGRQAGAGQMIYILIEDAKYRVAGDVYRPKATARVKVIDVNRGMRLFPEEGKLDPGSTASRGQPVKVELRSNQISDISQTQITELRLALAQRLGRDISRLFYDWTKPDLGSNIN